MMYNITTFKDVFQYQMAKFNNEKPQLLLHLPNINLHMCVHKYISICMYKPKKTFSLKKCRSLGSSFEIFILESKWCLLGICIFKSSSDDYNAQFGLRIILGQINKNFVTEEAKKNDKHPFTYHLALKNKNQL